MNIFVRVQRPESTNGETRRSPVVPRCRTSVCRESFIKRSLQFPATCDNREDRQARLSFFRINRTISRDALLLHSARSRHLPEDIPRTKGTRSRTKTWFLFFSTLLSRRGFPGADKNRGQMNSHVADDLSRSCFFTGCRKQWTKRARGLSCD